MRTDMPREPKCILVTGQLILVSNASVYRFDGMQKDGKMVFSHLYGSSNLQERIHEWEAIHPNTFVRKLRSGRIKVVPESWRINEVVMYQSEHDSEGHVLGPNRMFKELRRSLLGEELALDVHVSPIVGELRALTRDPGQLVNLVKRVFELSGTLCWSVTVR